MKFALLGLASAMLWGCKKESSSNPPGTSAKQLDDLIASIKISHEGKLREKELDMLDSKEEFDMMSSSDRRYMQKLLNALYRDPPKAGKAVTLAEISADIEEAQRYEGSHYAGSVAETIAADFESLSEEDKQRLKAFLQTAIEKGKAQKVWEAEIENQVIQILQEFSNHQLHPFEARLLSDLKKEGVTSASQFQLYKSLLDDTYGDKPKNKPATMQEISAIITLATGKHTKLPIDKLEGIVVRPDSATRDQLARIKGWFKYIEDALAHTPSKVDFGELSWQQ